MARESFGGEIGRIVCRHAKKGDSIETNERSEWWWLSLSFKTIRRVFLPPPPNSRSTGRQMQLAEDISISKSFSLDVAFFSLFWNSESRTISLPLFLLLLSVAVVFLVFTGNRFSKNDYFENWGGGKYGFFFCDSFARNRLENDFSEEEKGDGRREMIFDGRNRIFDLRWIENIHNIYF